MAVDRQEQAVHREAALQHIRGLIERFRALPGLEPQIVELAEHLERATRSFHMEAIRFRMYSLDRALNAVTGLPPEVGQTFAALRQELEAAGFHTRGH